MKINVTTVKKEIGSHQVFSFSLDGKALFFEEKLDWLDSSIKVAGNIVNLGGELQVTGKIEIVGHFECGRCLQAFSQPMELSFQESFWEKDSGYEADEEAYFVGDEIDISSSVQATILLAEPFQPLCSENCAGLCATCGVNKNDTCCQCEEDKVDIRLAGLKQLLAKK